MICTYKYSHCMSSDCNSGRRPIFPGKGVFIRQEPFAKIRFFKVDLKCFVMEQFLSWMNHWFSWEVLIRCRISKFEKLKFLRNVEICQNRSRNSIICFFVKCRSPEFKTLSNQDSSIKLCMQLPNNSLPDFFFLEKP